MDGPWLRRKEQKQQVSYKPQTEKYTLMATILTIVATSHEQTGVALHHGIHGLLQKFTASAQAYSAHVEFQRNNEESLDPTTNERKISKT